MAITGKLKKDVYHLEGADKAAKKLDVTKVKAEAKNAAKKLMNSTEPGTKTPFFVKKDYFKDPKDAKKSIGHFLAIGVSNLDKTFKAEKTSPEVAYGNFFIKKIKDKATAHFEYVTGQGKLKKPADWKVLLKEFKKAVKLPCVFVVDGQTVEADKDDDTKTAVADKKAANPLLAKLEVKYKELVVAKKADKPKAEINEIATKWLNNFKKIAAEAGVDLKEKANKVQALLNNVAKREQGGTPADAKATEQLNKLQGEIDDLIKNLGGAGALKKLAGL